MFYVELSEGCRLLVCEVARKAPVDTPGSPVAWYPPAFSAVHAVYVGVQHVGVLPYLIASGNITDLWQMLCDPFFIHAFIEHNLYFH